MGADSTGPDSTAPPRISAAEMCGRGAGATSPPAPPQARPRRAGRLRRRVDRAERRADDGGWVQLGVDRQRCTAPWVAGPGFRRVRAPRGRRTPGPRAKPTGYGRTIRSIRCAARRCSRPHSPPGCTPGSSTPSRSRSCSDYVRWMTTPLSTPCSRSTWRSRMAGSSTSSSVRNCRRPGRSVHLSPGHRQALPWTAAGFVLAAAALIITIVVHVPLTTAINTAGDPDQITDLAALRAGFEATWVRWTSPGPLRPPPRSPASSGLWCSMGGPAQSHERPSQAGDAARRDARFAVSAVRAGSVQLPGACRGSP